MEQSIFFVIILVFSAILHEYMHGFAAYTLGDPTAKNMGRLTLNPIPHIDPFYTVLMPLAMILFFGIGIGGAKPVPVNPFNLRGKYAQMKVALAGPLSNVALAVFFGLMIRFLPFIRENETVFFAFGLVVFINLLLAVFNLLPIPPLDGSHVLFTFFPAISEKMKAFFAQYGIIVLLGVILIFSRQVFFVLSVFINALFYIITGTYF